MSLINKLNKPISNTLFNKLSQIRIIPNVEFQIPSLVYNMGNLYPIWISGFITG